MCSLEVGHDTSVLYKCVLRIWIIIQVCSTVVNRRYQLFLERGGYD